MKSQFRSIARKLKKTDLVWRYASNLSPTLQFSRHRRSTSGNYARELIDELNRSGIVVTTIAKLFTEEQPFHALNSTVSHLMKGKIEEIDNLRAKADDENAIGDKSFNLELLGSEPTFEAGDKFAQFALNETFLDIANAYFGMYAKLRYYNVWRTFASKGKFRESQLWHFDREDNYILKAFVYLDDVDDGAGPFTYAPGTHRKGKHRKINPEFFMEGGVRRTTDDQMKAVYPEEKWVRAVGKKGTVIFADTRGFHKGGEARTKDRLMFTCMYTSPASESKRLIVYPDDLDLSSLSPKQIQALQHK